VRRSLVLLALASGLAVAGCGSRSHTAAVGSGRLDVVASFYPMADAAEKVGGERVTVTNLTPVGAEPHDIELSPRQVDHLADADLVVYVGTALQPAVAEIASRRKTGRVDVLDRIRLKAGASAAIAAQEGIHHAKRDVDPHFWLDPTLMDKAVDEVTAGLSAVSPDDAATFRANANAYKQQLETLDTDMRAGLADCDRHVIVTSHAAFFYLARRYGLTQLAIAGVSPDAEPNADRLAELTDVIKAKGITTVFFEELVSPKVSETLAREAGVRTAVLSPLEGLSRSERDAGKDYVAVMRDNLAALRLALGCR
jgi:zinc transport system substrate-binding protein